MWSIWWKSYLAVILIATSMGTKVNGAATIETNNLTLLVTSCDRYSSLWPGFFKQLFMHIPELRNNNLPIILIGNKKSFPDTRVTTVLTGEDVSWSDNMLKALEQVKTDYIFLILDDYYLTSFDAQRFNELYHYMTDHPNVSYLQLADPNSIDVQGNLVQNLKNVRYKKHDAQYRTALQACLWKTKDLKTLLKIGDNAHDFEISGSIRSQELPGEFLVVSDAFPLSYLNILYTGYVYENIIKAAQQQGITLEHDFPLEKDHKLYLWYKRTFLTYIYWKLYCPIKNFIKSFF